MVVNGFMTFAFTIAIAFALPLDVALAIAPVYALAPCPGNDISTSRSPFECADRLAGAAGDVASAPMWEGMGLL